MENDKGLVDLVLTIPVNRWEMLGEFQNNNTIYVYINNNLKLVYTNSVKGCFHVSGKVFKLNKDQRRKFWELFCVVKKNNPDTKLLDIKEAITNFLKD